MPVMPRSMKVGSANKWKSTIERTFKVLGSSKNEVHTDQVEQVALGGAPSFPGGRAVGLEFDAIEFSGRKCQLTVQSE